MALTVNCAKCHNHKFDPIAARDYYSLMATINGYVEIDVPLVSRSEAEAYTRANGEVDAGQSPLREQIRAIEEPYRTKLLMERVKRNFPENVQRAVFKPESERTDGEKLLAIQVLAEGLGIRPGDVAKIMSPEDTARVAVVAAQIASLDSQRPKPLPMAEIVTDGDWRFTPDREGDDRVSCPKCRVPPVDKPNGTFLHNGEGRYEVPPSHFLIKGDPQSKGSLMKPGFIEVATIGDPPTEIPRPDWPHVGSTSRSRSMDWFAPEPADGPGHC